MTDQSHATTADHELETPKHCIITLLLAMVQCIGVAQFTYLNLAHAAESALDAVEAVYIASQVETVSLKFFLRSDLI